MDDQTSHQFGKLAGRALTTAAASLEQSTRASNGSDDAHKRHFLQTFRRWSILFKRKENNVDDDKWLTAEYYDALRHLSEAGLDELTKILRESCTFFPTIKECLDATRYGPYDWGHPFRAAGLLRASVPRLAAPQRQIGYDDDGRV